MSALAQLNEALAGLAAQTQTGLVQVKVAGRGGGSGVIWMVEGERVLIVTNAHVLGRARDQAVSVVFHDGTEAPVRVLGRDVQLDLAAVEAMASGQRALPQRPSGSRPLAGEVVLAAGHPFGVRGAVSVGVLGGIGPELPELRGGRDWALVNLRLRPGNSGGPLVDHDGRVIGINTLMTGRDSGGAITTQVVEHFLSSLERAN